MKKNSYSFIAIIYTVIFVLLFGIAYTGFFHGGMTFVTKVDGTDQYYMSFLYFGKYLREAVRGFLSGNLTLPVYDLSIGMGEDILGALNYYGFGDPLYLVSVFADSTHGPFLFSMMFFVRLYLAGLSFLVYCHKMQFAPTASLCGVFCYIINGFTYGGMTSYMGWGSILIYMPLILCGVEEIFHADAEGILSLNRSSFKKAFFFIFLPSVYGSLCGFYFLYMLCVFLVVYCAGRGIFVFGIKSIKAIVARSLYAACFLILGIMLSACIFLPSISGFMGSERSDIRITSLIFDIKNWTPYWPVYLSFINKPESYYFKYICKVTPAEFIAVAVAFFLPKSKGKLQLCIANTIIFLVVALPITGYLFSGFGESGFEVNTRWTFLMHFIFALTLIYVLGAKWHERLIKLRLVILVCAFIMVLVSTGSEVLSNPQKKMSRVDLDTVLRNMDSPVNYSKVVKNDPGLYRISLDRFMTTSDRPENTAMISDYYGITYWLSIMNNYTQKASDILIGYEQEWRSDGFSHVGEYETALGGVKYYFSKGEHDIPDGYESVESFDYYGETWTVYENKRWFGLIYTRPAESLPQEDTADHKSYFGKMCDRGASSPARDISWDDKKSVLRFTTADNANDEAVIMLPYTKGFKAYMDGREVETYVTDLMCMGIRTGGGVHEVTLVYGNPLKTAALLMTVAAILLLFVLFGLSKGKIRPLR